MNKVGLDLISAYVLYVYERFVQYSTYVTVHMSVHDCKLSMSSLLEEEPQVVVQLEVGHTNK